MAVFSSFIGLILTDDLEGFSSAACKRSATACFDVLLARQLAFKEMLPTAKSWAERLRVSMQFDVSEHNFEQEYKFVG